MTSVRQYLVEKLQTLPGFRQVLGAAELTLQTLKAATFSTPAAFVLREEDRAEENTALNGVAQGVKSYWAFFILVRNIRDPRAGDSMDKIDDLRGQVLGCLLNHIVPTGQAGMEFVNGRLELQDNDIVLWKDTYMSYHYLRSS